MSMNRAEAEEALTLIRRVVNRVHDETVVQNWGTVMVVVGCMDLVAFGITQFLASSAVHRIAPYLIVWAIYLAVGLAVNLRVRTRMGGSMSYVERHIWGNGLTYYAACIAIVAIDCWSLEPARALALIPAHAAIIGAISFSFMALIDTRFFVCTAVHLAVGVMLAFWSDYGFAVLGLAWFVCLTVPGVHYIRERRRLMSGGQQTEIV